MNRALEVMAEEISQSLFQEVQSIGDTQSPDAGFADLVAQRLAGEVLSKLRDDSPKGAMSLYQDLDARLQRLETQIALLPQNPTPLAEHGEQNDGAETSFPNLKYAKSKYKGMESVLKYVDQDQEKGGLKLVIMNFND